MRVKVPSERNFEVFHAVETGKMSHREASRRFAISPMRVRQIVAEVQAFVLTHGSEDLLDIPPEKLELMSLRMCYERLSYFYKTVMRKHNALEAEGIGLGLLRLLHSAMRLSVEQTKIAARIGKVQQAMIEAGTLVVEQHEYVYEEEADEELAESQAYAPPTRGCTDFGDNSDEEEDEAFLKLIASLGPNPTSEQIEAAVMRQWMGSSLEKTPVQSATEETVRPETR